jgi:hypothetical protein
VRTQTAWARLATYAIEPAGFVMTRRMLLGLKTRAEALRAANTDELCPSSVSRSDPSTPDADGLGRRKADSSDDRRTGRRAATQACP